ncbi:MAG: septum formation inhibitor Maf [Gammaproteobacteria bacterium]|jgi:septum formation protein|nr:septum formation inhibitor Maf [Gammaproteobacteria bacterium]MBT3489755.1 septum formation inhibitor Maf [Gammaproteobacteria bacterium]MBT3719716.1 septum formation inhibitor Maf [Gammaproteobacteria bacterium]MBT3845490.1 septum formation inhibitor Maf [Gammaproteobacteria bacterium]MBT3892893.1 septum formation inhibitor Maf [Gammaproteobacteria bacterium]
MDLQPHIILASASPRRSELLTQIGVRYRIAVADIDETIADESPQQAVLRLAEEKASTIWKEQEQLNRYPVLGADTIVVHQQNILQKPASETEGMAMLELLSGGMHEVMSAIALISDTGLQTALSVSQVTFREITTSEQRAYWASGEPQDKAGGYAIQGQGAIFVQQLQGSYSGVMGLPLYETSQLLQHAGVQLL